jgi:glucosamine--fructose-6-phosphate aminotransferase (isomerizing)
MVCVSNSCTAADAQHIDENAARGCILCIDAGGECIEPAVFTVPPQLLSYHVAVLRGTDIDQPCNPRSL